MTRGKQIIEEAKRIIADAHERGKNDPMMDLVITLSFSLGARWADKNPDIDVRTMAAWQSGYKEAVDKACEWLDKYNRKQVDKMFGTVHTADVTINVAQFRKAMESGSSEFPNNCKKKGGEE